MDGKRWKGWMDGEREGGKERKEGGREERMEGGMEGVLNKWMEIITVHLSFRDKMKWNTKKVLNGT